MLAMPVTQSHVSDRTSTESGLPSHWDFPGAATRRHSTIDGVTYKVADCRQEREEAYRLVYDAYRSSDLIPANKFEMRVTPYHLLPTTDVFVAMHEGQVVYTITLVGDGKEGLPLETIFQSEVSELRSRGRLCEASCLAGKDGYFEKKRGFQVFVNLVGLMFQSARFNGLQQLLLAVHPRHARFYERFLGMDSLTLPRSYSAVLGNPAVLCSHDFGRLDQQRYRLYDDVYSWSYERWELRRQLMPAAERDLFAGMVTSKCSEVVAAGA